MESARAKRQKTGGRAPGTPNRATAAAREAIASFVDGNADRLQGWLDQIAEERGALEAFNSFCALLEFHVPKLARTELSGPNGGAIPIVTKEQKDATVRAAFNADS